MTFDDQLKIKCLLDILYQNNERIAVYEQLEKEIAVNTWLMSAYTEASMSRQEFKDIFNRELSGIRMSLHRLKTQYNDNKSDYEKRRLQLQNTAIKMLLEDKFNINLSKVINNFLSKRNAQENEDSDLVVSAEEEIYALIKETTSEGKSLYALLAEEEPERKTQFTANAKSVDKYKAVKDPELVVSAEEEVYSLIKETNSEGKSLYSLLAEEEPEIVQEPEMGQKNQPVKDSKSTNYPPGKQNKSSKKKAAKQAKKNK